MWAATVQIIMCMYSTQILKGGEDSCEGVKDTRSPPPFVEPWLILEYNMIMICML